MSITKSIGCPNLGTQPIDFFFNLCENGQMDTNAVILRPTQAIQLANAKELVCFNLTYPMVQDIAMGVKDGVFPQPVSYTHLTLPTILLV